MAGLHDMAKMTVTGTPGTGTITLNAAVAGFQSFAAAGAVDGESVSYSITDTGGAWEVGRGVYTSSGATLSRGPIFSSNSNAAVTLTSAAIVEIAILAEDMVHGFPPIMVAGNYYAPHGDGSGASGPVQSSGYVYLVPVYIPQRITISGIGLLVRAAYSGTGTGWGVAIYSMGDGVGSNPAPNRPFKLLASSSFSTSTVTVTYTTLSLTSNYQFPAPGWYWLAYMYGDATQTQDCIWGGTTNNDATFPGTWLGSTSLAHLGNGSNVWGLSYSATGGTWPTAFTSSSTFTEINGYHGSTGVWMAPLIASVP